MEKQISISQYWANEATDPQLAMANLKLRLLALDEFPAQVTLVSAGEVCILLDDIVIEFYRWLNLRCRVTFISAACTSIHAAILDFYHSELDNTVVIALELGKSLQQGCLNALGIGTDADQDGLDVVPGVGFLALKRAHQGVAKNSDITIEHCQILSQAPGMRGTPNLVSELFNTLKARDQQSLPVSFDICSQWGKSLLKGLDHHLNKCDERQTSPRQGESFWLSSIESCQRHYLSLKPLFELQLYQQKLQQHSLLLFTLGGGGRVGVLQLGKNSKMTTRLPQASFEQHCLSTDVAGYNAAQLLKQDKAAYYQQIRTTLKYPRSRYRGIANHYFKWHPGQGLIEHLAQNVDLSLLHQPELTPNTITTGVTP